MALLRSLASRTNQVNRNLSKLNFIPSSSTHLKRGLKSSCSVYQTGSDLENSNTQKNVATWSEDQNPKLLAMRGPRFEQTAFDLQPNPLPAIELISQEPVQMIPQRVAACDGGGGALGHPKVFINLDKPGPHPCGYCGLQFEHEVGKHH